ncbi:hypothetical protein ABZP36_018924 [Zizania latifolia]
MAGKLTRLLALLLVLALVAAAAHGARAARAAPGGAGGRGGVAVARAGAARSLLGASCCTSDGSKAGTACCPRTTPLRSSPRRRGADDVPRLGFPGRGRPSCASPDAPMSLRSGSRQLSFELLANDYSGDDADDLIPRSLPETSSNGQRRHRKRRSKRKRGLRSPPIEEEEPPLWDVQDSVDSAVAVFKVTDLKSVVEKVCESSDAERSAASCVTYVGVEVRQRSVSGSGRLLAPEDATSSCGSSALKSSAAAVAVPEVTDTAGRPEANCGVKKLEKGDSVHWERFMNENSNMLGGIYLIDHLYSSFASYIILYFVTVG